MAFAVRAFPVLDSTNAEARRQAAAGAPSGTVIVAETQTAGRGRRGRAWVSEPGNLYCSVLLKAEVPADRAAQATFAASLAVAEAVEPFAAGGRIACKWPNDVLKDGAKLAGILLEFDGEWLIVGVGVNVVHHPAETEFPAADLGGAATASQVLEGFLARLEAWLDVWRRDGFSPLRSAWLEKAQGVGQAVRVRLPDRVLEGIFRGLDGDGALILERDGRNERILAGDVFFPAT
jgi:BirA family biotin operon repressor/biotin-[acetyl-CoA-carboxylase] ligase